MDLNSIRFGGKIVGLRMCGHGGVLRGAGSFLVVFNSSHEYLILTYYLRTTATAVGFVFVLFPVRGFIGCYFVVIPEMRVFMYPVPGT